MIQEISLFNEWKDTKASKDTKTSKESISKNHTFKIGDRVVFKNQLEKNHKGIFIVKKVNIIYGIKFYTLKGYSWNIDSNMLTLKNTINE